MITRLIAPMAFVLALGISSSKAGIIYTIEYPSSYNVDIGQIFNMQYWDKFTFSEPNFITSDLVVPDTEVTFSGSDPITVPYTINLLPECPDAHGTFTCDEIDIKDVSDAGEEYFYFADGTLDHLGVTDAFFAVAALDVSVPEPSAFSILASAIASLVLSWWWFGLRSRVTPPRAVAPASAAAARHSASR